ncbi:MAG: hypothetical protein PHF17_04835 [Arcobacteraceae bacterium]|nr:hypothetical protein [Arcobacteraceae bacterium]
MKNNFLKSVKYFLIGCLASHHLYGLSISSDDDYMVLKSDKYSITFTKQYEKEASFIKENLDDFFKVNDNSFTYSFDEPLRIVLVSNNIQVANAFSTQIPYNMTAFYNGGSSMVDYFGTTSWLETILTHELIHNYQLNAKKSEISKTLHKYLGNNFMPVWASLVPLWTLPNLMLPTGLLEGNAVLNESIYENGGRLYNGRFKALTNSLAFANKITPNSFINDTLEFPYTEGKYIIGGYYMSYLASIYGVDKVNSFFYNHSIHSINPFLLNETFYETFGVSYQKSFINFVQNLRKTNQPFASLEEGRLLATSNSEIYLSKIDNEILFLSNDLKTRAILNRYDSLTTKLTQEETTLKNGTLFTIDGKLYSSSEGFISSTLYKQGLFDKDANILPSSSGKAIQDIKNNKVASFEISESFDKPALYLDDKFIDFVASSAILDNHGAVYYFKQDGIQRTLYKDRTPLFSFDGYVSKVVDIIDEAIYFTSNTTYGSGLYKYENGNFFQITKSDNIISAKIIDQNKIIVTTINSDGYKAIELKDFRTYPIKDLPQTITMKNPAHFEFKKNIKDANLTSSKYNELEELQFSMLYPYYISDSTKGNTYSLSALFIDPVMFNMVSINVLKDYDSTVAGATYVNERYIPFELSYYNIKQDDPLPNDRGYFAKAKIYGPLFKNDLQVLSTELSHYKDDDYKQKEPTTVSLKYAYSEDYKLGSKPYFNYDAIVIGRNDRGETAQGFKGNFNHYLFGDTYFDLNGKILKDGTWNPYEQKGIKLVDTIFEEQKDLTNVFLEGLDYNMFVKKVNSSGVGLSSTFYFNKYFPVFPVSFRKERIFGSYNSYNIETSKKRTINEKIVGVELDLLFFHKLSLPLTIKYIQNDYAVNDKKVLIQIGGEF